MKSSSITCISSGMRNLKKWKEWYLFYLK
jgi:hypothetical protein